MGGVAVDPIAASAVRVSVACAALNGVIGMGIGMTFIMMAPRKGDVGMVAILSSVTPVLVLPLLWWRLGRAPAPGAWVGAGLTVVGTGLILLR